MLEQRFLCLSPDLDPFSTPSFLGRHRPQEGKPSDWPECTAVLEQRFVSPDLDIQRAAKRNGSALFL